MTFEIEVNGRVHAVSVERLPAAASTGAASTGLTSTGLTSAVLTSTGAASAASTSTGRASGHRFRVTVDGVLQMVDAVRVDGGALSLIRADGDSHHVAITEGGPVGRRRGDLTLTFAEGVLRATVNGRRARRGPDATGPAGAQQIVAPMPGKVLRVLVQPGDEVAARQPLVVVEAMKMENELSSPRAGRVKDVAAIEGQSVEAGRLLVVVE